MRKEIVIDGKKYYYSCTEKSGGTCKIKSELQCLGCLLGKYANQIEIEGEKYGKKNN